MRLFILVLLGSVAYASSVKTFTLGKQKWKITLAEGAELTEKPGQVRIVFEPHSRKPREIVLDLSPPVGKTKTKPLELDKAMLLYQDHSTPNPGSGGGQILELRGGLGFKTGAHITVRCLAETGEGSTDLKPTWCAEPLKALEPIE